MFGCALMKRKQHFASGFGMRAVHGDFIILAFEFKI
jgi:hypothetical protein